MGDAEQEPKSVGGFLRQTVWQAWGALVVLGVGAAATAGYFAITDAGSVEEQLSAERSEAAEQGQRTILSRTFDFRGTGGRAFLLVLRDNSSASHRYGRSAISDEIRIYEDDDGDLDLRFRFRPKPIPPKPITEAVMRLRGDLPADPGAPYLFELKSLGDRDGNGRPELIGAFSQQTMTSAWPLPVVLGWDDGQGEYSLRPLITERPKLQSLRSKGFARGIRQDVYMRPATVDSAVGDLTFAGYRVEDFTVRVRQDRLGLVGTYLARSLSHATPTHWEVASWQVDLQPPEPEVFQCPLGRKGTIVVRQAPAPRDAQLARIARGRGPYGQC